MTAEHLTLEFLADPAGFLVVAGDHLAQDPVLNTVVATTADRAATAVGQGVAQPAEDWWLVVRGADDVVVGAGMRTAPFAPRPPFLLPMPRAAARRLARALHQRGETVPAVNGALPAVEEFAAETARLTGGSVSVVMHTRLFELRGLVVPRRVPGRLRRGEPDDLGLALAWFEAFMADADEQAGRTPGTSAHEAPDADEMLSRIEAGRVWFWVDETGRRVHMTAANPPSFGAARIGPVYTPAEARGRGYASNAVAEVSRHLHDAGVRACLFTDQANPTSNAIYQALGYRPVVDMANLCIA